MAVVYPGAQWRPLGSQSEPEMVKYDIVCLHTMVGNLYGTDRMFHDNGYGGTESHFGVGGIWDEDDSRNLDGVVYQWQDLRFQADANLEGNPRVISVETADNAPSSPSNIKPWTSKQCEAIAHLVAWCCERYGIPPVLIPDTKPSRRGIGYHRQGCEHSDGIGTHPGFLVSGGERWSNAIGKTCPTDARIAQITSTIIPRVQAILNPTSEELMSKVPFVGVAQNQQQAYLVGVQEKRKIISVEIRDYLTDVLDLPYITGIPSTVLSLWPTVAITSEGVGLDAASQALTAVTQLSADVEALAEAVAALQPPTP